MKLHVLRAVLLIIASATTVSAQTTAGGSVRGRIFDPTGAAIGGTTVTATSPNIAGTFKVVTDSAGDYRLIDLPPDVDYTIRATRAGFAALSRTGIIVRAGLNQTLDLELQVGNLDRAV